MQVQREPHALKGGVERRPWNTIITELPRSGKEKLKRQYNAERSIPGQRE
jgi:hypothetical protein